MATLVHWYLGVFKTHPFAANIGSALVLMIAGDLTAQRIEIRHLNTIESERRQPPPIPDKKNDHKIHFRRYGTMTPDVEKIQHKLHEHEHHHALSLSNWPETLREALEDAHDEMSSLDLFRTATMGVWAAVAYAPFWIGLYRIFDRYLPPIGGPHTIALRVGLTYVASVPLNAAFYCYGSYVHHLAEWYARAVAEYPKQRAIHPTEGAVPPPMQLDQAWTVTRLKLQTEMPSTMLAGVVWVPINTFNFAVVPSHLRPLTIMVCSAGWNCYLSLAQHRDVVEDEDGKHV